MGISWYKLITFLAYNVNEQCGSEMVGAVWVTEMSSPFLHLRELLKELGYKDTLLNLVADVSIYYQIFLFHL